MQLDTIDPSLQKDTIDAFWGMLRECEVCAENHNDAVLKHHVEDYYKLWNRITGQNVHPSWVVPPPAPSPNPHGHPHVQPAIVNKN